MLAGSLGGLSFLVKLSGLFFLGGAGLFLLAASHVGAPAARLSVGLVAVRAAITLSLGLVAIGLWRAIAPLNDLRGVLHFVLPAGLLAAGLAVAEWSSPPVKARARLEAIFRATVPFALDAVLTIGRYALAVASAGGVDDAIRGVFVTSSAV